MVNIKIKYGTVLSINQQTNHTSEVYNEDNKTTDKTDSWNYFDMRKEGLDGGKKKIAYVATEFGLVKRLKKLGGLRNS